VSRLGALALAIALAPTPSLAAPMVLHHVHLAVSDVGSTMRELVRTCGAEEVMLRGVGVGVRLGAVYALFERARPPFDPTFAEVTVAMRGTPPAEGAAPVSASPRFVRRYGQPVAGLREIALEVPRPAEAARWFAAHVGATLVPGTPSSTIVQLEPDAVRLVFRQRKGGDAAPSEFRAHLGFGVPDVPAALAALAKEGVRGRADPFGRATIDGPGGLSIELLPDDRPGQARFHCPMDADVVSAGPGRCPKCGMKLLPLDTISFERYPVTLSTTPAVLRAGQPGTLWLRVTAPTTDTAVTAYDVVHEQRLHLFIISTDLETFAHVHPALAPDSVWSLPFVFPRPGTYRLIADFLPSGSSPQLVPLSFTTADTAARPIARARLAVDADQTKHVDGVAVRLQVATATVAGEAPAIIAGRATALSYQLSDDESGAPIADLELYLGALGHLLAVSEDLADAVHAHPLASAARADGTVRFELLFPRPGRYRVWAQFQRRGRVFTVPYSVEAVPLR
jgi:hypothetical protein